LDFSQDILPRTVVRACYAAGMIHSLEGWKHNDLNDEISTYLVDKTWDSAIKRGFALPTD
jgi:predicted amino acid dehydrogenase